MTHPNYKPIMWALAAIFALGVTIPAGYFLFLRIYMDSVGGALGEDGLIDYAAGASLYANRAPQWGADGQTIVVNLDYRIYHVDTDGTNLTHIPVEGQDGQFSPSLSADGRIAYMDDTTIHQRLITASPNGGAKQYFTGLGILKTNGIPAWSPDGHHIAFASIIKNENLGYSAQATIIDDNGALVATHDSPIHSKGWPVWSNRGEQVAFTWAYLGCAPVNCAITVSDLNGAYHTIVNTAPESDGPHPEAKATLSSVAWSPDDRTIYYALQKDAHLPTILYATDLTTMESRPIAEISRTPVFDLRTSPDGSTLMFVARETPDAFGGEAVGIYLISTDGADLRDLTEKSVTQMLYHDNDVQASWSPDGKRIAVVNNQTGILITMAPDGSDRRILIRRDADGNFVPGYAQLVQP